MKTFFKNFKNVKDVKRDKNKIEETFYINGQLTKIFELN